MCSKGLNFRQISTIYQHKNHPVYVKTCDIFDATATAKFVRIGPAVVGVNHIRSAFGGGGGGGCVASRIFGTSAALASRLNCAP